MNTLFGHAEDTSTKTLLRNWKLLCARYGVREITLRSTGCETRDSQHGQALSRACKDVVVRILDREDYLLVVYKNGGRL